MRGVSVSFLFVRSRVNYANTTNNPVLAFELRKRTLELQRLMAELVMLMWSRVGADTSVRPYSGLLVRFAESSAVVDSL